MARARASHTAWCSHKAGPECYTDTPGCSPLFKWGSKSLRYLENNLKIVFRECHSGSRTSNTTLPAMRYFEGLQAKGGRGEELVPQKFYFKCLLWGRLAWSRHLDALCSTNELLVIDAPTKTPRCFHGFKGKHFLPMLYRGNTEELLIPDPKAVFSHSDIDLPFSLLRQKQRASHDKTVLHAHTKENNICSKIIQTFNNWKSSTYFLEPKNTSTHFIFPMVTLKMYVIKS